MQIKRRRRTDGWIKNKFIMTQWLSDVSKSSVYLSYCLHPADPVLPTGCTERRQCDGVYGECRDEPDDTDLRSEVLKSLFLTRSATRQLRGSEVKYLNEFNS